MRFITFLLTGLTMLATSLTSSAATPDPVGFLSDNLIRLPNGLSVLIKKDTRFPLVSLRLYVRTGSTYESFEDAGISHLLEHMVFKGTEKRPKGGVATEVESVGGYLNAATSFDYTVYLTDMPKESWKIGLDVLKDMAFHASIDPKELESEKEVVLAELKRGEDSPMGRLFRITLDKALDGTPYRIPIIGYEPQIRAATQQSIKNYIAEHYQPQNMLVVICGDVDEKNAFQEVEKLFADLVNTSSLPNATPFADFTATPDATPVVEKGPWNKVHIAVSMPVPSQNDVRSPGLDVLAHILGGDPTSRFYHKYKYIRQEVDSISVSNYGFARQGLFLITATLDADKLAPFWEEFTKDLAGLSTATFTQKEIERAQLSIEDSLFRSKETLAGLASKLGYFQFFGDGEFSEKNYLNSIASVDPSYLSSLSAKSFSPNRTATAVLTPETMPETVAGLSLQTFLENTLKTNWKSLTANESAAQAKEDAKATAEREVIDLGEGRELILLPDPTLPYAAVNMIFIGGDSLLTEKSQGLGMFTASLLTKGTKNLSAPALEEFLADRAAGFSASSGRQTFSIAFDTPTKFLPDMFALLHNIITEPALLEKEAERVRQNQIARITATEDQPTGLAFRRLFPFLFSHHPYGFMQLGTKEIVSTLTEKDAASFWKKQAAEPWSIAICGTFDREEVLAAVKKLPPPTAKEVHVSAPAWRKPGSLSLSLPKREQAHLLLVFPTVGMGHEDEAALDLLQNVLAGQSGLLFADLRDEQGLGYTVTAFPWKSVQTGALIFYIGTDPDKINQAQKGFETVIKQLQTSLVKEEDLQRGKQQMIGDYYRGQQKLNARSIEAATLSSLKLPLGAEKEKVEKAQSVTANDLKNIAVKYLNLKKAYTVTVLP